MNLAHFWELTLDGKMFQPQKSMEVWRVSSPQTHNRERGGGFIPPPFQDFCKLKKNNNFAKRYHDVNCSENFIYAVNFMLSNFIAILPTCHIVGECSYSQSLKEGGGIRLCKLVGKQYVEEKWRHLKDRLDRLLISSHFSMHENLALSTELIMSISHLKRDFKSWRFER